MFYHEQSEDYRPLFWINGRPIYANTLLVMAHVTAFVIAALAISYFGSVVVGNALALDTFSIWHEGQVWRLFSYIAFDPDFFDQRSLWFLINIVLFYFFGREVEQYVGRKTYLKLYAALVLTPAALLCLLGLIITPVPFLNCCEVFFGVFVAFATIYPGVIPSCWIPLTASTLVWILLGVSTLIDIAFHQFTAFFMLWASSAVGYFGMRLVGAGRGLEWLTDWIEDRRTQKLVRRSNLKVLKQKEATESIDAILDKISQHGVASLNASERAALERARTQLLKRDQR